MVLQVPHDECVGDAQTFGRGLHGGSGDWRNYPDGPSEHEFLRKVIGFALSGLIGVRPAIQDDRLNVSAQHVGNLMHQRKEELVETLSASGESDDRVTLQHECRAVDLAAEQVLDEDQVDTDASELRG